jgi:hypothetical protein
VACDVRWSHRRARSGEGSVRQTARVPVRQLGSDGDFAPRRGAVRAQSLLQAGMRCATGVTLAEHGDHPCGEVSSTVHCGAVGDLVPEVAGGGRVAADVPPLAARTRAPRWGVLTARQRSCADSMSLNAMARAAARDPGLLVTLVRCRTVAKVDSIGFVVRRCTQCSAG